MGATATDGEPDNNHLELRESADVIPLAGGCAGDLHIQRG
jgi:hypothetical protein